VPHSQRSSSAALSHSALISAIPSFTSRYIAWMWAFRLTADTQV
jgi:hypothetical protein